jgi:hypothetical protein
MNLARKKGIAGTGQIKSIKEQTWRGAILRERQGAVRTRVRVRA